MRIFSRFSVLLLILLPITLAGTALAKTEQTIRAFSVWQTSGTISFVVAGGVFEDTIAGLFYVDTEKGPVAAGSLSCKAKLEVKADRTQTGSADCTIAIKDGAEAYGKLQCSGVFMVGCAGDFTFSGGSGRFQGLTGGGKVVLRSEFADVAPPVNADATHQRSGIMYFSKLHYILP